MRVLVLHGSPRKQGNSSFLAVRIAELIKNAHITHEYLYDLDYKGCKGCMSCRKTSESCVMRDDITDVLKEILLSDVIIFASGIYHGGVTGEMKCLIDRCFSFLSSDHFERRKAGIYPIPSRLSFGKTAVAVFTQGQSEDGYTYVLPHFQERCGILGFTHVDALRGCNLNSAKDSRNRQDLFEQAEKLAERLSSRYS